MPRDKRPSDALRILDRIIAGDAELHTAVEEERAHAQVARDIYALRTSRGLTQRELAEKIGTTQSVIARLEDADYEGHSLRVLRRIAELVTSPTPRYCADTRPAGWMPHFAKPAHRVGPNRCWRSGGP